MSRQLPLWPDDDGDRLAILRDQIEHHHSDVIGVLMAVSEAACRVRRLHPDDRLISANDTRHALRVDRSAPMMVRPSVVGPVFAGLSAAGLLRRRGPIPSTDDSRTGRNADKWVPQYAVGDALYRYLDCSGDLDTHRLESLARVLFPHRHGLGDVA